MPTYPNTHEKVKNKIFNAQFQGIGLGLVSFEMTIWATQIQVSFTELQNPKNPGIQPSHAKLPDKWFS